MKKAASSLKTIAIGLFSIISFSTSAQSPVKEIGKVKTTEISGQTVNITTENAFATITIYSPNIIRVRIDKQPLKKDFSYAVIASPLNSKANITQTDTNITIVTDSIKAIIQKQAFSVAFYTLKGEIINQDEPGLTTSWIGEEITCYKKMQTDEKFIGLGEKTGGLNRAGNGYTNWNTDAFAYGSGQDPLYATIPFYIGIHQQLNYGIFFDNSYQSDFNFGASNNRFSSFGARGGEMNYYFIYHTRVADIITSYTALTGRMPLPPLWSLGYQQNRYSYYPETEVMRIAQTLREKKIPADGITLDIHYMDAYKLFTWNKERFPDPKAMIAKLNSMGLKTTVIVDPGIKVEKDYGAYERGVKENIFLKYSDGQFYTGGVWPGLCHFTDYTSEKGRSWWKNEIKFFANDNVSGIWNDMNEIATWGQKMPNNVLFDFDGRTTTHQEGHNVYGMQMARSSYEGMKAITNKRPFILTRAAYAGFQRYSAIWTGDNRSEDDHMLAGVRLLNSLGLSGVAFTGMDIGGFTGNPSVNLFIRWMQVGAFIPYYRNHTVYNSPSAEPWAHGEDALDISRNYINLRYRLMPYLYSAFYEATQNGLPVVRSLAIDYTFDSKIYSNDFQNQFLFGQSILIAPVKGTDNFTKVYFPKDKWYNLYTDEIEQGNSEKNIALTIDKLPVYVKESSIIPMQSLVQSTAEKPTDTLTIHIYKGDISNAYIYYEDDGETYTYEKGNFYKREITYTPENKTITFNKTEGNASSKFNTIKIILHGFSNISSLKINGSEKTLKDEKLSFLSPVANYSLDTISVKSIILKNDSGKISVTY